MKTFFIQWLCLLTLISSQVALSSEDFKAPRDFRDAVINLNSTLVDDDFDSSFTIRPLLVPGDTHSITVATRDDRVYFYLSDRLYGSETGYSIEEVERVFGKIKSAAKRFPVQSPVNETIKNSAVAIVLGGIVTYGLGMFEQQVYDSLMATSFIGGVAAATVAITGVITYFNTKYGNQKVVVNSLDEALNHIANEENVSPHLTIKKWDSRKYGRLVEKIVRRLDSQAPSCAEMVKAE